MTPLVRSAQWLSFLATAFIVMLVGGNVRPGQTPAGAVLVGGVLLTAILLGAHWLGWSKTTYFFDQSGDLRLDSGILSRTQRRIALSRLQSVEVVQPLLARLVGLAEVRVEAAGSGDSRLVLSFLAESEAQALRNEILARAAGVRPDAGEAPEQALVRVPTGDLALSLALRSETVMLVCISGLVIFGALATAGPAGLLTVAVSGLPVLAVFGEFSKYFDFSVSESPDGLRLRHGLLKKETRTVPPNRVHAVEVYQPFLWRKKNWVRLKVNLAGVEQDAQDKNVEQVLIPVAPWDVAMSLLHRVLPGVDVAGADWVPAPDSSRKRSPFQWKNLAVAHDEHVFMTRRGYFTRRVGVIPHARTQSVRVTQGPWERALGLGTMHVDSVPGSVLVRGLHRTSEDARRLAEEQESRAAQARIEAPRERWLATDTLDGATSEDS